MLSPLLFSEYLDDLLLKLRKLVLEGATLGDSGMVDVAMQMT